jgi:hypothetical protein
MNRNRVALCLLTGLIITGSLAAGGTKEPSQPQPTYPDATTFSLPPLRPLNREIFDRVKDRNALQYYISAWVILENVKFWDYPDSIDVTSKEVLNNVDLVWHYDESRSEWGTRVLPHRPVNGISVFDYGGRKKEIVIDKETPGILLEDPTEATKDSMILKVCFDPRNPNDFLQFKQTAEGLFILYPPGDDSEISYGGSTYRQRIRKGEVPLLLIRGIEDVRDLLYQDPVPGRKVEPPQRPTTISE